MGAEVAGGTFTAKCVSKGNGGMMANGKCAEWVRVVAEVGTGLRACLVDAYEPQAGTPAATFDQLKGTSRCIRRSPTSLES